MTTPIPSFPPVRACLFDMDGLLIDSEDIYTLVTNKILHEYGRPSLPWSIKAQLQGRPGPEAIAIFYAWASLPITAAEYQAKMAALQRQHFPSTQPLPGVTALLSSLQSAGSRIALATSSHVGNYGLKSSHLPALFSFFPPRQRVLGDDPRIGKGRGKPAPDIYLLALETINAELRELGEQEITGEECLVFEDSVPGVEAGRRAGMRVVWCPHPELLKEFKGKEEDVLAGQTDQGAEADIEQQNGAAIAEKVTAGWPGKRKDGWAELLNTLEDFDYAKYGINVPDTK